MFWSRNDFFKNKTPEILAAQWIKINSYLDDIGGVDVAKFKKAYDYFCVNPDKFDGATIVKDLINILDLDLSAMVHDYDYYILKKQKKGFSWIRNKLKYDFNYGANMEKFGKGITTPYLRVLLLWVSTPFYLLIILFKK